MKKQEYKNVLKVKNRKSFRKWLEKNYECENECYVLLKRGRPVDKKVFYYIDAVEEALCFGWIDSTVRKIDGVAYQRFSKRKNKSLWTPLNIARVERLEKLGLMTDAGRKVICDLKLVKHDIDKEIRNRLKKEKCMDTFLSFPKLYQNIRVYNVNFYKNRDEEAYNKALEHLIRETKKGKMYGEWNDYGRLMDFCATKQMAAYKLVDK